MKLLNDQSSEDAIVGTQKMIPIGGRYMLIVQATNYDDANVNVEIEADGLTFNPIDEQDGTAITDITANSIYTFFLPNGAKVQAKVSDPTTGVEEVNVSVIPCF